MKTFLYKAKDGPERSVEGRITAVSVEDAVARLNQKGYTALYVKELTIEASSREKEKRYFFGISSKELVSFTVQMARLLKSGITMLKALSVLSEQTKSAYFKGVLEDMTEMIGTGTALSASMEKYPKIFSRFYISMINAGEKTGTVNESLNRIADYYIKQQKIIKKVRSASAYPALILIAGIFTILFVFTNVLPKIMPVITGLNTALPLPTRMLLGTSLFMKANWVWIVLFIVLIALIIKKAAGSKAFNVHISALKQKIPVFGNIIYKSELSRFARRLEISIRGGVQIMSAINTALSTLNETAIRDKITSKLKNLELGASISSVFQEAGLFSPMALATIKVAEETGNLPEALSEIAENYEPECEENIEIMVSMIEPVMILLIGLIVGFIVSAVLLPIFQISDIQF